MFDDKLKLCSAQTVTTSAISNNVIDLDSTSPLVAEGRPLYVYAYLTTAWTSSTTLTIAIELYQGTTATVDTEVMELQEAQFTASYSAGRILKVPLPIGKITSRYLGLHFTCSSTVEAGTVDAYLAP